MALVAPPVLDRKRVKVYELKSNDWFDRGTGFCTGTVVNVSDPPSNTLLLHMRRRGYASCACHFNDQWLTQFLLQEEARILVQSEDEPERTLLETKISKENGYHPQQGQTDIQMKINYETLTLANRYPYRLD